MNWINFFDGIYCINLAKRQDRLIEFTEEAEKYSIPFELITAIEHSQGAEGLRLTIEKIFENAIEKNYEQILIFEDDCVMTQGIEIFHDTMNNAIKQLPKNWDIMYLSGQVTCGFKYRHSANLLQLDGCFATHSWAISLQGMKEILSQGLYAPIDNCLVDRIQKLQRCYITYPILTTQRAGTSDIGGQYFIQRGHSASKSHCFRF